MGPVRFGHFLFVLVLSLSVVSSAPPCQCKGLATLKTSEQSCLLNQLLHIISHLVGCSDKPAVTPEGYKKILEATNCKEEPDLTDDASLPSMYDTTPISTTYETTPSPMDYTISPIDFTLPPMLLDIFRPVDATPSPTVDTTPSPDIEPPQSKPSPRKKLPIFDIFTTQKPDTSYGESSESESSEPFPYGPIAPITLSPYDGSYSDESYSSWESSEASTTESSEIITESSYFPTSTKRPKKPVTEPSSYVPTTTTKPPKKPVTEPSSYVPTPTEPPVKPVTEPLIADTFPPVYYEEPTIPFVVSEPEPEPVPLPIFTAPKDTTYFPPPTEPPLSLISEPCPEKNQQLPFRTETFFIPVLKFHGAPALSTQELRDYLFKCLPSTQPEYRRK